MHYSLLTEETMEAFFKAAHQENLRPEAIWIIKNMAWFN